MHAGYDFGMQLIAASITFGGATSERRTDRRPPGPDFIKGNAGATEVGWPVDLAVGALYIDALVCEDFCHLVDGEVG